MMINPDADLTGTNIGNYRLLRFLEKGGFARVYLGEHIHLGTQVAIKILHTQIARDDIERFRSEARTVANLDHPHVVKVLDFGLENSTPYLVMSYAPNGSLRLHHREGIPLPLSVVVSYVKQIADALQFAHDRHVVHRDVKPENILLDEQKELLLSDFGIALILQTSRSNSTPDFTGTIAYMAPEQSQGHPVPASDQYALGIMTFEWLCGVRPFQGTFMELLAQHATAPVPSLCERQPSVSLAIENVVLRALAKEPQQRFPTVKAFADALERASYVGQSVTIPVKQPQRPAERDQPDATGDRLATQLPSNEPLASAPVRTTRQPIPFENKTSDTNKAAFAATKGSIRQPVQAPHTGPDRSQTTSSPIPQHIPLYHQHDTPPAVVPPMTPFAHAQPGMPDRSIPYQPAPPTLLPSPRSRSSSKTDLIVVGVFLAVLIGLCALGSWISLFANLARNTAATSASSIPGTPITSLLPTPLPATEKTLYTADWSKGIAGWTGSSEWEWLEGGLLGSTGTTDSRVGFLVLSPYHATTSDYAIEAQIQFLHSTSYSYDFGLVFRSDASGNGYICDVDSSAGVAVDVWQDGSSSSPGTPQPNYTADNGWHTYRVEVKGNTISCFIDGQLLAQATDNTYLSPGLVGLRANNAQIDVRSFQVQKL